MIGSIYANRNEQPYVFDESGYNLALLARWRGWSVDFEWGTESYDFEVFDDDFDREGWRVSLGWLWFRKNGRSGRATPRSSG